MRVSLLFPHTPLDADEVRPFADLVRLRDAHRLWMGTSPQGDPLPALAYLAGAGYRVPVGTSVQLTPLRHPFQAAADARALSLLTGRPVVAGFGAGTPEVIAHLLGRPYERPAAAVRDYLAEVRRYLDGGDALLAKTDHPRVELAAGVLRPGMARAAAGVADAAVTWMTPPEYLRDAVVPALGGGTDRPPRLVTVVHAAVRRPGRDARALAFEAAQGHLSAGHYVDMLNRAGLRVSAADPWEGAGRLVDGGVFLYGSAAEVAEGLKGYAAAGADEVVINPAGATATENVRSGAEDAAEILAEFHDQR
ncbi:LLM class flavin-dependent oxidoreductase [Nocardiopsis sp. RSe5-2]|uniref:LLM class flavin-dependent oxidoreductase n=1 Tax=Nocardiopsis endophytica TaxID=3018445 RepID=A0ABT4U3L9_9ACTN|nr:LLM class flavin-dependent oxidoreductase [Nocardiopsis endophytica]MDA2811554.1 LLM class flavin-dependent oxidoreductase [Nocardiopsis endophytica]